MQKFLNVLRWTVGILFIFSGLIKANDPLGLSYKMIEYLGIWNLNHYISNNSFIILFAIIMNILEIVSGVALIIKFPYKQTLWLLLGLILFFTFLTGYSFYTGKPTTCGCLGNCIPLTPKVSFFKDLILLISIIILIIKRKTVKSTLKKTLCIYIILFSTVLIGYGQYYVLNHLPLFDCLPYKVGNDIVEKMKLPLGAIPDGNEIIIEYKKNGKSFFVNASANEEYPADIETYEYIKTISRPIIGNGLEAEIKKFELLNYNTRLEFSKSLFSSCSQYNFILINEFSSKLSWNLIIEKLNKSTTPYYFVFLKTSDATNAEKYLPVNKFLLCNEDVTMNSFHRLWPTIPEIVTMKGSVIMQKQSYLDFLNN